VKASDQKRGALVGTAQVNIQLRDKAACAEFYPFQGA